MNKHYTVGLIFLLGITISVFTFLTVKYQLNIHKKLEFQWTASEHYRAFHKQLEGDIDALQLHKILDNFQLNKPEDFKKFSKLILKQHKSIQSLYWLPANTINHVKNNTNNITEPWSLALNKKHNPGLAFRNILLQTQDSGKINLSKLFSETQSDDIQNGFIGLSPVYNLDEPTNSIEQRRKNLLGFVMGVFLFSELFDVSIGHLEPRGIDIYLLQKEASKKQQLLYHYKSRISRSRDFAKQNPSKRQKDKALKLNKNFTITGQDWLFIAKATPEFRSSEAFNQGPAIALLTGIIFTAFIGLYFHHLSKAKDAWQAAEKKLHAVLDHSPDYIIIFDKNSLISYMNKPLFGLEPTTSIGQNFFDWLPDIYHKRYQKGLSKAFVNETADFFNYSLEDSTHWEVRILPIRTKNKINSAMIINTDITQQHEVQIQTMENSRLASIGVLATGIAHEINNPNNSIYYNASFLQDSWNDILPILDEYKEENGDFSMGGLPFSEIREKIIYACDSTIDHTTRIKKIVATLKSFARKNSGDTNEDVQVIDVIGNALLIINNEVRKHTDSLSLDLPNNLPKIKGNAQKLEQVFINIVLNALQALPAKDKKIYISTDYDEIKQTIKISVRDEGIGIDEQSIDKITQPFYTTKPDNIGTGLGLSISNSIIKEHNGKLIIESKLNKGTTVTILLPVAKSFAKQKLSIQ